MKQIFTTPNHSIIQLLDKIETGELGLPELQRPLVWKASQVRDLFDSLMKGYPIGFIMLWDCQDYSKKKKIGKTGHEYDSPKQVIIDGQQRLTTLYSVIKGKEVIMKDYSEKKFAISYNPLLNKFEVKDKSKEKDAEWIEDITEIYKTKSLLKYIKIFIENLEKTRKKENEKLSDEEIETIEKNIEEVSSLKERVLMTIEIQDETDEEEVADIFVRVNSQGVSLTQNDFILTLLSINWEDGRRQIEKFCEESAKIPEKKSKSKLTSYNRITDIGAQDIIRVVMAYAFDRGRLKYGYKLLRGANFDKKGEVDNKLKEERFSILKKKLPDVIEANNWHEFLKSLIHAGYVANSIILSTNTIFYCYAFYLIGKYRFKVSNNDLMHIIGLWFYFTALVSMYTGSFESEVETELNSIKELNDKKEFIQYFVKRIEERLTNDYFKTTIIGSGQLNSQGKKGNNAFNAYIASLVVLGTPVLFSKSNTQLSQFLDKSLDGNKKSLELHHLFPKEYLKGKGYKDNLINQMANYAYIDWKDNLEILDEAPSKYYPEICKKMSEKEIIEMEEENALPHRWEKMKYEEFLIERRKLMSEKIKKAYDKLKKLV